MISDGNIQLSHDLFCTMRDYLYETSGLYYADYKKYLLEGRLLKRINDLNMNSFQEYYNYLLAGSEPYDELNLVYNEIARSESYFFQNKPQIDALQQYILPEILQMKSDRVIRILSAPCNYGEEPYTLAMALLEVLGDTVNQWEVKIIGMDDNPEHIRTGKQGVYSAYAVRNAPRQYILKYFQHSAQGFRVTDAVRRIVSFEYASLGDAFPAKPSTYYDVIFSRNQLISLAMPEKEQLVKNFTAALQQNGHLFLGQMETLHSVQHDLFLCHFPRTMSYVKRIQGET